MPPLLGSNTRMRHPLTTKPRKNGAVLLVCSAVLVAKGAHAQDSNTGQGGVVVPAKEAPVAATKAPPVIVPPQIKSDKGAEYPAVAVAAKVKETVDVVVVVDVDKSGAVTKARVETAVGNGFDESAVAAAEQLVFEPATRDGVPIAARVKHRYTFAPPASRISGKIVTEGRDAAIAGATVSVVAADGTTHNVTTAADGAFAIPDLPFGSYRLEVSASGFAATSSTQQVEPGESIEVVLRMARENAKVIAPTDEVLDEVRVTGKRPPREVTKRTLEQRELTRIPGTNGDALRAIQNLPGVARPPGLAGLLIVRGSAPNDTNVFVDGTLIPLVYHFGGLSSVIPTEMLDKIDFYPGNFSAMYGRVTGGVVDVGVKDPVSADKKLHGMVQVDLIDARAMARGPIGDTGWNFALAGRRSYFDVWLKPVLEAADAGVTTAPVYYDYQAILHREWKNQSLRFMFFGSDDRLRILIKSVNGSEPGLGGGLAFGTAFYRFQARYTNKFSDDTEFKITAAVGKDAIDFNIGQNYFRLDTVPITVRTELSQKLASSVKNNFGLDMLYAPYDVDIRLPAPPKPGEPPAGPFLSRPSLVVSDSDSLYRPALYDEVELTPWRGSRIITGVRLDYAKDTKSWDVGPRFAMRQDLTKEFPRTTIKGGVGQFAQPPQPQETSRIFGQSGLTSNRATHYGLGAEQELTRNVEVSVEGFYKQLDNLVVAGSGNSGVGRVAGVETLLRYKPDSRFFGFLAYTLSRSTRRPTPESPEYLFQYDQTHILTALGSYRLGRGWEFGARYRLISGSMTTPQSYGFYDLNVGSYLALASYPPNSVRNPMFHQLDLRIDKTWTYSWGKIGAYLDVLNVYNQGNPEGVSYNYNSTLSTRATGLPILPSLGLRGEL